MGESSAQPRPTPHFLAEFADNQNAARDKVTCASQRSAIPDRSNEQLVRHATDNEWMRKQLRDDESFMPPPWCDDAYGAEQPESRKIPPGLLAMALTIAGGIGFGVLAWNMQDSEAPASITASMTPALEQPRSPVEAFTKAIDSRIAAGQDAAELLSAPTTSADADIVAETASIAPVVEPADDMAKPTEQSTAPGKPVSTQAELETARHYRLRADENMLIGNVVSARALYFKAFQLGDAEAAYQLGRSYDAAVLAAMNVIGPQANAKLATDWYRQAKQAGYVHDGQQPRTMAQDAALFPSTN